MLKVSNLSVNYGDTRVVDQLNVNLGEDEILMLIGPTGCGKTTVLRALAGLIPIDEGEISLPGWTATAKKKGCTGKTPGRYGVSGFLLYSPI